MTARRYVVAAGLRARASTSGLRVSRSSVHASPVAVVSWPGEQQRHQLVADLAVAHRRCRPRSAPATSSEQMSVAGRRGAARRSRSSSRASISSASSRSRSSGLRAPEQHRDLQLARDRRASRSRRRSCSGPRSLTPKTARRITSSVIACMLGWTANVAPIGPAVELALGRLAAPPARRRACGRRGTAAASPCGARGARRPPAAAASARPTSGPSVTVRPGGRLCPRSEYSARITSGEETITSGVLKPWNITLNVSP